MRVPGAWIPLPAPCRVCPLWVRPEDSSRLTWSWGTLESPQGDLPGSARMRWRLSRKAGWRVCPLIAGVGQVWFSLESFHKARSFPRAVHAWLIAGERQGEALGKTDFASGMD